MAFRARPPGCAPERIEAVNRALPEAVQARGRAFVTGTVYDGRETMRACILHPGSTETDLATLVAEVVATAADLAATVRARHNESVARPAEQVASRSSVFPSYSPMQGTLRPRIRAVTSKRAGPGSRRLGRFDSFAASLSPASCPPTRSASTACPRPPAAR